MAAIAFASAAASVSDFSFKSCAKVFFPLSAATTAAPPLLPAAGPAASPQGEDTAAAALAGSLDFSPSPPLPPSFAALPADAPLAPSFPSLPSLSFSFSNAAAAAFAASTSAFDGTGFTPGLSHPRAFRGCAG